MPTQPLHNQQVQLQVALAGLTSSRLALLSFLLSAARHPVDAFMFLLLAVLMATEPLERSGLVGLTSSRLALLSLLFSVVCQVVDANF